MLENLRGKVVAIRQFLKYALVSGRSCLGLLFHREAKLIEKDFAKELKAFSRKQ